MTEKSSSLHRNVAKSKGGSKNMPGSWKKYEFPQNQLDAEKRLGVMTISEDQAYRILLREAEALSVNQDLDQATRAAWAKTVVDMKNKMTRNQVNKQFIEEFIKWLGGRSEYNAEKVKVVSLNEFGVAVKEDEVEGTPWGNKPLTFLPGVSEFMDQGIDRRSDVIKQLTKLKMHGPRNLDEAWIYYKYLVRHSGITAGTIHELEFLSPFDYPTGVDPNGDPVTWGPEGDPARDPNDPRGDGSDPYDGVEYAQKLNDLMDDIDDGRFGSLDQLRSNRHYLALSGEDKTFCLRRLNVALQPGIQAQNQAAVPAPGVNLQNAAIPPPANAGYAARNGHARRNSAHGANLVDPGDEQLPEEAALEDEDDDFADLDGIFSEDEIGEVMDGIIGIEGGGDNIFGLGPDEDTAPMEEEEEEAEAEDFERMVQELAERRDGPFSHAFLLAGVNQGFYEPGADLGEINAEIFGRIYAAEENFDYVENPEEAREAVQDIFGGLATGEFLFRQVTEEGRGYLQNSVAGYFYEMARGQSELRSYLHSIMPSAGHEKIHAFAASVYNRVDSANAVARFKSNKFSLGHVQDLLENYGEDPRVRALHRIGNGEELFDAIDYMSRTLNLKDARLTTRQVNALLKNHHAFRELERRDPEAVVQIEHIVQQAHEQGWMDPGSVARLQQQLTEMASQHRESLETVQQRHDTLEELFNRTVGQLEQRERELRALSELNEQLRVDNQHVNAAREVLSQQLADVNEALGLLNQKTGEEQGQLMKERLEHSEAMSRVKGEMDALKLQLNGVKGQLARALQDREVGLSDAQKLARRLHELQTLIESNKDKVASADRTRQRADQAAVEHRKTVQELSSQITRLRDDLTIAKTDLSAANGYKAIAEEVETLRSALSTLQTKYDSRRGEMESLQLALDETTEELNAKKLLIESASQERQLSITAEAPEMLAQQQLLNIEKSANKEQQKQLSLLTKNHAAAKTMLERKTKELERVKEERDKMKETMDELVQMMHSVKTGKMTMEQFKMYYHQNFMMKLVSVGVSGGAAAIAGGVVGGANILGQVIKSGGEVTSSFFGFLGKAATATGSVVKTLALDAPVTFATTLAQQTNLQLQSNRSARLLTAPEPANRHLVNTALGLGASEPIVEEIIDEDQRLLQSRKRRLAGMPVDKRIHVAETALRMQEQGTLAPQNASNIIRAVEESFEEPRRPQIAYEEQPQEFQNQNEKLLTTGNAVRRYLTLMLHLPIIASAAREAPQVVAKYAESLLPDTEERHSSSVKRALEAARSLSFTKGTEADILTFKRKVALELVEAVKSLDSDGKMLYSLEELSLLLGIYAHTTDTRDAGTTNELREAILASEGFKIMDEYRKAAGPQRLPLDLDSTGLSAMMMVGASVMYGKGARHGNVSEHVRYNFPATGMRRFDGPTLISRSTTDVSRWIQGLEMRPNMVQAFRKLGPVRLDTPQGIQSAALREGAMIFDRPERSGRDNVVFPGDLGLSELIQAKGLTVVLGQGKANRLSQITSSVHPLSFLMNSASFGNSYGYARTDKILWTGDPFELSRNQMLAAAYMQITNNFYKKFDSNAQ